MNPARRKEFMAILAQVASIPRPIVDYETSSNARLAALEFIRRLMEIQSCLMLTVRATGKYPATSRGLNLILRHSMEITPQGLAEDYESCGEREIVAVIAHLKVEELFIGAEIEKRLADKRIGTVLILAPFFEGSEPTEKWLTKQLGVDRIKAYGTDRAVEDHDIRYESVTRALDLAARLAAPSYEPGPLPAFPLEMNPREASFWNRYLAKVWRKGHETLQKGLIPVLNGEAERIPDQVRNYRREEWRKNSRRSSILKGTDEFPTKGPDAWRANWDWIESAQAHRSEDIRTLNRPKRRNDEDINLASIQMSEIVRMAKKKLGAKVALALRYMAQGLTDEDIAARLNISRGSRGKKISSDAVRSYRIMIKKMVAPKK